MTDEPDICMVFNDLGNAIDSFPYTAEALRERADALDGVCRVTFDPSPFLFWPAEHFGPSTSNWPTA